MQKLLIATTNQGKLKEYRAFLATVPVELVSLSDIGIDLDVEETGKTYQENSQLKATTYAKLSGLPTIADDGGIESVLRAYGDRKGPRHGLISCEYSVKLISHAIEGRCQFVEGQRASSSRRPP